MYYNNKKARSSTQVTGTSDVHPASDAVRGHAEIGTDGSEAEK